MIRAGADLGPGVLAGFTSSAEGNLGLHVGDVAGSVADRRRALAAALGVPVLFARQVHGATARSVDDLDPAVVRDAAALDLWPQDGADALVTTRADRGLGVLVADCVPVLLADPAAPVVAVAHAGRVGLLDGVLSGVLEAMRDRGCRDRANPGGTRSQRRARAAMRCRPRWPSMPWPGFPRWGRPRVGARPRWICGPGAGPC